ncbi:MAG: ECF transporter S component [Promethearchaeota archaeon]
MDTKQELEPEKTYKPTYKDFMGYYGPTNTVVISMIATFAALTFIMTWFLQIPLPATGGYINVGDIMVMYTALLFGPIIGGLAGGIGSCLADALSPYAIYTPGTLIIKGIEGFLIGIIANPKRKNKQINYGDILAVIIGGFTIVIGYFIYEAFILGLGIPIALVEVPGNFFQFGVAAISSILLAAATRKYIIEGFPQVFDKIFISQD